MASKTKVLIYYSRFASVIGGGEYLPLSLASEFQRRDCEVVIAVVYDGLVSQAAKRYGISLDMTRLKVLQIKPKGKFREKIDSFLPVYTVRRLKTLAKEADVCISAQNIIDFGVPAHHFVCDVRHGQFGDTAFSDYAHGETCGFFGRMYRAIRHGFLCRIVRPMVNIRSIQKIVQDKREHVYPNSRYVDSLLHGFYGDINSTVYYPPTFFSCGVDAGARDPLLVKYIGRIDYSKRISDIIDIVAQVRRVTGCDLKLDIAGQLTGSGYVSELKRRSAGLDWLRLHGAVYGEAKVQFLQNGTYAIHAERDETFGISVTEYLKAGIVAVVPNEGGAKEIVDAPALSYDTKEDAVQIFARLLSDVEFRNKMRSLCSSRAKMFSRDAYLERQHAVVDKILESSQFMHNPRSAAKSPVERNISKHKSRC